MTRTRAAALALGTAAVAVGIWLSTGEVPPAPPGAVLLQSLAMGPCEAARALAADAGAIECEPGELVTLPVQVMVDPDGGVASAQLPPGFVGIPGTTRELPTARARRPGKALTVVPASACIVGEYERGGVPWDGRWQTSVCCGPDCECAGRCRPSVAVHLAGHEDLAVRRALCRAVPEHETCPEVGP